MLFWLVLIAEMIAPPNSAMSQHAIQCTHRFLWWW